MLITKYTVQGYKPIRSRDGVIGELTAAETFAGRIARREYGKRGYARTLRVDCYNQQYVTYSAFIGYDVGDPRKGTSSCSGHNTLFTMHIETVEI